MREPVFVVTGATGFVGRRLCAALQPHGHVRAVLRRPADGPWDDAVMVDLAQAAPPDEALAGASAVFHLAGKAHARDERGPRDGEHRALTVDGTRRLLDACSRAAVARFVFASSVKAMGEESDHPLDESAPASPCSAYGESKLAAERLVLDGSSVAHAVVLRLPLVYGPGQKGNLARMLDGVSRRRFPPPPRVANRRTMIHVDDVARAAVLASQRSEAAGRVLIVGDGRAYSTREIYEWIAHELGLRTPAWGVPLAAFRMLAVAGDALARVRGRRWLFDTDAFEKLFGSAVYDTSAARKVLGFVPEWDLRRALPAIIDEFQRSQAAAGVPAR